MSSQFKIKIPGKPAIAVPSYQQWAALNLHGLLKKPFKYINPKAVDTLLGKYSPVSSFVFSKVLDDVLCGLNEGYAYWSSKGMRQKIDSSIVSEALVGSSDKLLKNNLSRSGLNAWDFFDGYCAHEPGAASHARLASVGVPVDGHDERARCVGGVGLCRWRNFSKHRSRKIMLRFRGLSQSLWQVNMFILVDFPLLRHNGFFELKQSDLALFSHPLTF